ncbi:outer membrane lipoprotein carrier protein LolA [Acetobacteraceae bacterium H6797]|nr:outer membrane lipoprotein carrier protein LolA [Acetobacteraceae bacterium H6797]
MLRRALTASMLALPTLSPFMARAQTLSNADRNVISRVERYLNGLTTLQARFLQVAQNGGSAEGTAMIWRPGRMRFDYDPPVPLLLVADSGQFLHYDRELRQRSIVPVSSTPLGILLRSNIQLNGDVIVRDVERSAGFIRITMAMRGAESEGTLTLVLQDDPIELRQWVVVDQQRRETRVSLSAIQTGMSFDRSLFTFNDPRFMELEDQRRQNQ